MPLVAGYLKAKVEAELAVRQLLERWFDDLIKDVPDDERRVLRETYRYDWVTCPVVGEPTPPGLSEIEVDGELYLLSEPIEFAVDVPYLVARLRAGLPIDTSRDPYRYRFLYRRGADQFLSNHEEVAEFFGKPLREDSERNEVRLATRVSA